MKLKVLPICLFMALGSAQAIADSFVLISHDEYSLEKSDGLIEKSSLRTCAADSPKIELKTPDLTTGEAGTPVDIELMFAASEGALIDMSTFNVRYGFLKLDITDRLLSRAEFTENGLRVVGAEMPDGKHRLRVSISDDHSRSCVRNFNFRIVQS